MLRAYGGVVPAVRSSRRFCSPGLMFLRAMTRSSSSLGKSKRAQAASQTNLRAQLTAVPAEKSSREFRRLFALVKQEKWQLAAALSLLVVSSGIGLSLPAVIGKLLDVVNDPSPEKVIWGMPLNNFLVGLTGVFIVGSFASYSRIVLLRSIGERLVTKLRARAFRNLVLQDAEFFDANRVGDLISRLGTDANVVSRSVTQNIADGLRSVLTAGMGVGMMCFVSIKLTGMITLILPPVLISTWLYGRKVRQISRGFQESIGELSRVGEERLNNIGTARAFGSERQEIGLYNRRLRDVFSIAMQEAKAAGLYVGIMQITGNTMIIGLLALGASLVSAGQMSFGELSSFIMYTAYSGSAISGLGNFYSELMKGAGAASRLFEVDDHKPQISTHRGQILKNPRGGIKFDHVAFTYPTRPQVQIFRDLNFDIKPGQHVCIVGQSGGGKSTVLSLLLRFYDPVNGKISIGGQDLKEVSPWSIRRNIGVVSQEPVLFSGSVAYNIAYSRPTATREEIYRAANQANCTFLEDFPNGIDTQVGPRGTQLSGGQKQRIAIARAIITRPAVLVLDEATSALDGESETLVNAALAKLIQQSSTTISVAHRISTIARSNEVIVLGSNGTAIEQGSFRELYNDPNSALSDLLRRHTASPSQLPQKEKELISEDQIAVEAEEEDQDIETAVEKIENPIKRVP